MPGRFCGETASDPGGDQPGFVWNSPDVTPHVPPVFEIVELPGDVVRGLVETVSDDLFEAFTLFEVPGELGRDLFHPRLHGRRAHFDDEASVAPVHEFFGLPFFPGFKALRIRVDYRGADLNAWAEANRFEPNDPGRV